MLANDPLWYKDAIIYEVHVRAFHDNDVDGFGDFRGLTQKLDYLEDLGVTAVWLLPFYPSPLKDDGYDIADYTSVHPQYGTLEDFQEFLTEAHHRGIQVITELVVNHTSDQHPWFQRARYALPGSPERDFYVWSDSPEKYKDARIIFQDFEPSNWSWDRVAKQYYWHRFYSHQPDLNYDNPAVWQAIFPVVDFWMDLGVDGMRLDAVPYLFEREGTNCENLPETHEFLKALRKHVDERYPNRMFIAEANQWPEDAVAYFGNGDECQMAFHFPVMPRLFMALHQEDRFPILDILSQTPAIPESCQWCMFLRNHDELTLEMVTDEERDYMYRAYAEDRHARINLGIRHRLAPLLKNDRRRIELMNALLFAMPGTPVIYYGDEIGMGDNIFLGDRNGVRTPMQWSSDRNAGFSRANPQRLFLPVIIDPEYHYEAINVETLQSNSLSLLWWMKRLIALRKRFQAFGRGTMEFLRSNNPKVLAFIRKYKDERILVVANLSRFVQFAELDLREYAGVTPEEVFGRTPFPRIGELPYLLTMGPHGFFWFSLPQSAPARLAAAPGADGATTGPPLPTLPTERPLAERFVRAFWDEMEALLPAYLTRHHPGPGGASVTAARIAQAFQISPGEIAVWFLFMRVEYREAPAGMVTLPLAFVPDDGLNELVLPVGDAGFARVPGPVPGVLCDAMAVPACARAVLRAILTGRTRNIETGEIASSPLDRTPREELEAIDSLAVSVRPGDRNNLSVVYGEAYLLKAFRQLEDGVNPDLEIGRYLARQTEYNGAAPVVGFLEYRRRGAEPTTLAVLHRYVANNGTAWQHTLDELSRYFERVAALSREKLPQPPAAAPAQGAAQTESHRDEWQEAAGAFLETTRVLGRRTAEMHLVLAGNRTSAFAPEPFGKLQQRSVYQSMRNLTGRLCRRLQLDLYTLPDTARDLAARLLALEEAILKRFRTVLLPGIGGSSIRCHGDFHLTQLLFTGKDFVVSDFTGETARTVGERRVKRSPLRDVATMVRSLDTAVQCVLLGLASSKGRPLGVIRPEDQPTLAPWAETWFNRVSREYVAAYMSAVEPTRLLPTTEETRRGFLEAFILERALQEIDYDLSFRPTWAVVPLRGALRLLENEPGLA